MMKFEHQNINDHKRFVDMAPQNLRIAQNITTPLKPKYISLFLFSIVNPTNDCCQCYQGWNLTGLV